MRAFTGTTTGNYSKLSNNGRRRNDDAAQSVLSEPGNISSFKERNVARFVTRGFSLLLTGFGNSLV